MADLAPEPPWVDVPRVRMAFRRSVGPAAAMRDRASIGPVNRPLRWPTPAVLLPRDAAGAFLQAPPERRGAACAAELDFYTHATLTPQPIAHLPTSLRASPDSPPRTDTARDPRARARPERPGHRTWIPQGSDWPVGRPGSSVSPARRCAFAGPRNDEHGGNGEHHAASSVLGTPFARIDSPPERLPASSPRNGNASPLPRRAPAPADQCWAARTACRCPQADGLTAGRSKDTIDYAERRSAATAAPR